MFKGIYLSDVVETCSLSAKIIKELVLDNSSELMIYCNMKNINNISIK